MSPAASTSIRTALGRGLRKRCPHCGEAMQSYQSHAVAGLIYELCHGCGGVWLDQGELGPFTDPLVALGALMSREFDPP